MGKAFPVAKSYTQMDQEGPVSSCACMSMSGRERERNVAFLLRHITTNPSVFTFVHLLYVPVCLHSLVLSSEAFGID